MKNHHTLIEKWAKNLTSQFMIRKMHIGNKFKSKEMSPHEYLKNYKLKIGCLTLLQGRHTEGPETYEKMLSITSHQRDAN